MLIVCLLIVCLNVSYAQKRVESVRPLADSVKKMAERLIKTGFTAGDGYGEVWIRDMNTFVEVSCKVNDKTLIKKNLIRFLQFQQPEGGILDGYVPNPQGSGVVC